MLLSDLKPVAEQRINSVPRLGHTVPPARQQLISVRRKYRALTGMFALGGPPSNPALRPTGTESEASRTGLPFCLVRGVFWLRKTCCLSRVFMRGGRVWESAVPLHVSGLW